MMSSSGGGGGAASAQHYKIEANNNNAAANAIALIDAAALPLPPSPSTLASPVDRVEWSRATILGFIEDYRRQRVLWDPNTKGYHIKQTKYEALKLLSHKYGTEIRSIRSKIKSLRSSFHREHGKVLNGRNRGVLYQPMWFAYEAIRFILDGERGDTVADGADSAAGLDAKPEVELEVSEADDKLALMHSLDLEQLTATAAATQKVEQQQQQEEFAARVAAAVAAVAAAAAAANAREHNSAAAHDAAVAAAAAASSSDANSNGCNNNNDASTSAEEEADAESEEADAEAEAAAAAAVVSAAVVSAHLHLPIDFMFPSSPALSRWFTYIHTCVAYALRPQLRRAGQLTAVTVGSPAVA